MDRVVMVLRVIALAALVVAIVASTLAAPLVAVCAFASGVAALVLVVALQRASRLAGAAALAVAFVMPAVTATAASGFHALLSLAAAAPIALAGYGTLRPWQAMFPSTLVGCDLPPVKRPRKTFSRYRASVLLNLARTGVLAMFAGLVVAPLFLIPWVGSYFAGRIINESGVPWLRARHRAGKARSMRAASELADHDGRDEILYLRPFALDHERIGNRTLGELTADQLWRYGPVHHLPSPYHAPQLGPAFDPPTQAWRKKVDKALKRARLIVIAPGVSDGLRWELDRVCELGLSARTLVVVPPTPAGWPRTAATVESLGSRIGFVAHNPDLQPWAVVPRPGRDAWVIESWVSPAGYRGAVELGAAIVASFIRLGSNRSPRRSQP
jgi:hypothetical protein